MNPVPHQKATLSRVADEAGCESIGGVVECGAERCDGRIDAVFRALANADRRAILRFLHEQDDSLTISAVSSAQEMSRFTASRHLSILVDAGLVDRRQSVQAVLHRIRPDAFDSVDEWLGLFL